MSYRKTFEVIGYADDGALYCLDCFDLARFGDSSPVFLGDEYDLTIGDVCDACQEYLDGHEPEESEVENV